MSSTVDQVSPNVTVRVAGDAHEIEVVSADGQIGRYNRFWLRDNCPSSGDRATLDREASVAELPEDLVIRSAQVGPDGVVRVQFSDGVVDDFPPTVLAGASPAEPDVCWRPWRAGHEPDRFVFGEVEPGAPSHHLLVEAIARDGFAIVDGLQPDDTERLAELLGPVRETDFGRLFDIVSEPDPFTPSQSQAALDPHTDDPYRYGPSGVSILHCVSPSDGDGGASTIVDGFAIAVELSHVAPEAFELLVRTPIPYLHVRDQAVEQGAEVHLRADAPVIRLDASGRVCGIRFHERSMAPLALPVDEMDAVYRALMRFARAARGDEFAYHRRLAAGEAIVYDNQRVMHGRSAISGTTGRRHLRLCTIDRDQVHSRLRRLRAVHRPGTEHGHLPAGNLA
ncbi:MAG: TauD/TfdA family dioxygenase [Ilumatobacter sp.]